MQGPLFTLGFVHSTPAALDLLTANKVDPLSLLRRHANGDWGDIDDEDKELNNLAVKTNHRVLSAYTVVNDSKVWIITEATTDQGRREYTTILLPEEY